ncbi:redoxin domain-containing protein [Thermoleophilum album]|uniref:Peroxiredoxin n=1 Tax=Thermoleophilum album TaxID=29539 RepID=A0A1H6FU69_THEAL|nr:redoxin domain-containing protein [Thermoleophilum album]SEH14371.1 Peroxiredoxin [Thermoleophilum album]
MAVAAGQPAPEFTLPDHEGREVSLSDLRGRWVLLVFYPLDFSPVCTDQLSVYEEALPELRERGVEVLGISVDSPFCHRAFREQLGISTTLLSDFHPKGAVTERYGFYIGERGHGERALVLIDPDGIVRWSYRSPTPLEIPGINLVFDALEQAVA